MIVLLITTVMHKQKQGKRLKVKKIQYMVYELQAGEFLPVIR
jgi:hypothetical protein